MRKIFSIFVLTSWAAVAAQAEVQIFASLDRQQVAMNEQARLVVVISGDSQNLPDPQLPGLNDFQISNAGSSQNFSWVNGQTNASVTHTYVLTPKQVGRFTIPPIKLQSGGQTLETPAMLLEVVQGNAAAVTPPQPPGTGDAAGTPIAFVNARVDKNSVFVGEPVTYSFRLYNRAVFTRQPQYQPPNTSGFWTEDLPPQRNFRESVKGVPYQVVEVKTALFPTQPGKPTIGQAMLNVTIQNLGGDLFSGFFGGGQSKTLQSEPISVTVNPLPTPAPSGFRGAVGSYTLRAELDKPSGVVGQPLTLSVTVSGQGNIKSLPDLAMPVLTNFRTFDANAATNIEKKDYRVQGSKVFKTVLIPTTSGTLSIPPISFVYFDPAARSYKTLTSKVLEVSVKPGTAGSPSAPMAGDSAGVQAPGIKRLHQDIHYIKTPATLSSQREPLYRSKVFRGINAAAVIGLALCGMVTLYRRVFLSDPARVRFRGARGEALKRVQEAEAAVKRGDKAQAVRALSQGLQLYLSGKLGLFAGGISAKTVNDALSARQLPAARIQSVRELWERLDLLQFAPSQVQLEDLEHSRLQLRELLAVLEKDIRWID